MTPANQVRRSLAIDEHLVMGIIGSLHHGSTELHRDILICKRARKTELENSGRGITKPVIFNEVLCHDICGQYRGS